MDSCACAWQGNSRKHSFVSQPEVAIQITVKDWVNGGIAIDKNRDDQNYDWGDQIFDESAQNDCYHKRNPAQIKYSYHNP